MFILNATNISHSFDTLLFENLNFTLKKSQSKAILGRSGCGKSTLLHIFSTFIKPKSGKVVFLDKDLYSLNDTDIEKMRRYDIGIIFQFHYLFKGMTALENVEISSYLSSENIDNDIFKKLEIEGLMRQKIGELSGGQQQRVAIARVLAKKPSIIFADEPTGNLDKETANLVFDVLLSYIKDNDASLILVTHDEDIAKRCDKVYKLEDRELRETI